MIKSFSFDTVLFGTILHAPPSTSFTAFLVVNVVNFTSAKRADVYLTDLLNNDVNKPVAGHFNTAC